MLPQTLPGFLNTMPTLPQTQPSLTSVGAGNIYSGINVYSTLSSMPQLEVTPSPVFRGNVATKVCCDTLQTLWWNCR